MRAPLIQILLVLWAGILLFPLHADTTPDANASTPPTPPAKENPWQALPRKLAGGGTTVFVQLALSLVGGAFLVERLKNLRRDRIAPHRLAIEADALWQQKKFGEILKLCEQQPSSLSRIIAFIVPHRGNSLADLSRASGDMGAREIRAHLQKAYPLMVIGMLEPLLGLLGTVLGMIDTFSMVSESGSLGDASLLAGGISKFLICTGTGLTIAVPCLAFYHYFKTRTIGLGHILEEEVDFVLHRWFLTREKEETDAHTS